MQPAEAETADRIVLFPAPDKTFLGHPRGLAVLALTEAWERFSFSGMQTLLVLYMVGGLFQPGRVDHVLGFAVFAHMLAGVYGPLGPLPLASAIFGLYTGLVFFMPVIGGYVGDRWLGQHRTVLIGAVLMAAGHFLMAFDASFLIALALLILGAGCLKGNISTQVSGLYSGDDRRRTDGFQIFAAGINLGVIVAPLVCGTLGEVYGWHYGFAAAGIGMMIGLAIYVMGRRYLPPDSERTLVEGEAPTAPAGPGVIAVLALVFVLVTCFLATAGQLGNVYSLWIKAHVARSIGGWTIPVTWFQTLTPIFTIAMTPALLKRWQWQAADGREAGLLSKMGAGLLLASTGLALLAALSLVGGDHIPGILLLPTHLLVSLGYMFTWPVGLALFSRAAPEGARAMYIGIFFISSFVASNLIGWLGGLYATMPVPLFWLLHAAIGVGGALLVLLFGRLLHPVVEARLRDEPNPQRI